MIFDSNILIYISQDLIQIENLIPKDVKPKISVITYIEALGYPFKSEELKLYMQEICDSCDKVQLSEIIIQETIHLRSKFKIKLADAIIYATASVERLPLLTNNIDDFKQLDCGVELINPFTI